MCGLLWEKFDLILKTNIKRYFPMTLMNLPKIKTKQIGLNFVLLFVFATVLINLTIFDFFSPLKLQFLKISGNVAVPKTERVRHSNNESVDNIEVNLVAIDYSFFQELLHQIKDTSYPGVDIFTKYVKATRGGNHLKGQKELQPEFGPVINDVTFYEYPIQIPACQTTKSHSVLSIVMSAPKNFWRRDAIRETWGSHLKSKPEDRNSNVPLNLVGFAFAIGLVNDETIQKQIEEENKKYGDILQIGMIDTYYNLTVKVAGLLNWIHRYCPDVDFVLKTDDDVFVNVNNFAAAIRNVDLSEKTLYGTPSPNLVNRGKT